MIYEPREDSYLLAEQVRKLAFGKVLDVGTGSGIQALRAAASKKVKSVLAVDISDEVVSELKKEIKNKKITIRKSDLFSNAKGRFDTIIFNPPYLPLDIREPEDSRLATTGGKKGYEALLRFISDLNDHLTKKGFALIVFSSLTKKGRVDEAISDAGFEFEELSQEKIAFETLYVYKIKRNWLLNELFTKKITKIKKLMKGHRGVIFTGYLGKKKVAIKAQRFDLKVRTIEREADMIKLVNKYGIAPELIYKGKNYFIYGFAPGLFVIDFLKHSNKTETINVFLEVFSQCRTLDKLNITKEEMTNPYKHVIVDKKVVLVDFERAHVDDYPQNVTQFCQYVMRNKRLFETKGIYFDKDKLISLTKHYKKDQTEVNYKKIYSFVSKL
jgi:HemK-related putative methylase